MKSIFVAIVALSTLVGTTLAALGQGMVTYTPLSSPSQLNAYDNEAVWILLFDISHNGTVSLMNSSTTNLYQSGMNEAQSTSIQISEQNGTLSVASQILNGSFGSTGYSAGTNISSLSPVSGLVFGVMNPYESAGDSQIVNDLYVGSNYQPTVADTAGVTFDGMMCSFSSQTTSLNALFDLTTPVGSAGQVFVIGLEPSTVPEPSSLVLASLGGATLLALSYRRKK